MLPIERCPHRDASRGEGDANPMYAAAVEPAGGEDAGADVFDDLEDVGEGSVFELNFTPDAQG